VLLPTKLVSKQICTREKKKRFIPGRRRWTYTRMKEEDNEKAQCICEP
jgi:hypothetical protein